MGQSNPNVTAREARWALGGFKPSRCDAARGDTPRPPLAGLTRVVLVQDSYGEDESSRLVTVMS